MIYIVFEGIDTTGKSTQIKLLKESFDNIIITKEPGGTDFGKIVRKILLKENLSSNIAETFLFLADRAEHFKRVIETNKNKHLIVSDRGFISGIAYSMAREERDLDKLDKLIELNSYAMNGTLPDLVILFEIDKKELMNRLNRKSMDRIEQRGIDYMLSVQRWMNEIIDRLNLKYFRIDATEDIDSIHKKIVMEINRHLELNNHSQLTSNQSKLSKIDNKKH